MIEILARPQPINFSQSIQDFRITTDKDKVVFTLELNGLVMVHEEYDAPPAGVEMTIKLKDLIENFMEFSLPIYAQDITNHENGIKNFQFKLVDTESTIIDTFKVIKGFLRPQPFDVESYLRDYWLNIVPQHSEVYFHQPLYLTALPPENVIVTVKAKMVDGTDKIITIGEMEANKLQSVNLNPGRMIYLLGGNYIHFDAYTVNSTGSLVTGLKKFFFKENYEFLADVFFYHNRLGGWDTLVLNGERINRHSNTAATAVFNEIELEYQNVLEFEIEKSSGYMATEEDYRQYIDFLFSRNKYFLHQGALIPIVTSENKTDHTKGKLNGYSFIFRPSNTKLYYPEIGATPNYLIIT